jgi:predicted nucleic acid-binding protein
MAPISADAQVERPQVGDAATIPRPDLVIAQATITGDLTLWHVDDRFQHLRRHTILETQSFVPATRG